MRLLWGRWHRAKGGGTPALASWREQLWAALEGALGASARAGAEQGTRRSVSDDEDHHDRDEPPALWVSLGPAGGDGGGYV